MNSASMLHKPPGFLWVVILGIVGFSVGFVGPMIFMPDSNLGPIIGVVFTGPGGAALGIVMFFLTKAVRVNATAQWRILGCIVVIVTVGILLYVQPEPATRGYLLELEVTGTRSPLQASDQVVADWKNRFAGVTWAKPRDGWEAEVRATLASDQGTVLDTALVRRRVVMVKRKPWNRGQLFAKGWEPKSEAQSFYLRPNQLPSVPGKSRLYLFLPYDSTEPIHAPDAWPPREFEQVLSLSRVEAVPPEYAQFQ